MVVRVYVDDWLLLSPTVHRLIQAMQSFEKMMKDLGFLINPD